MIPVRGYLPVAVGHGTCWLVAAAVGVGVGVGVILCR